MWEVLRTVKEVADKSFHVRLDNQAAIAFARKLEKEKIAIPSWNTLCHFQGKEEDLAAYLLVLDSINFCFWPAPGNPKWEVEYQSEKLSGYFALAASLKKALESGLPLHGCSISCRPFL